MNRINSLFSAFVILVLFSCAAAPAAEQSVLRLPLSSVPATVDGVIAPDEYADAIILDGAFKTWGIPIPLNPSPTVYFKRTRDRLYIAYDNPLPAGERPLMRGAIPDNAGICADNAMEIYILPTQKPGALLSFIQVAGNPRGCIYDTWVTPQIGISDVAGFSIPWQFKNSFPQGHWYSELSATFDQMRFWSTKQGDTFDIDFCRDGGFGAGGASGYNMAYGSIASGLGTKVTFDDNAPIVQWLSFGHFENNKFDPKLILKSSGAAGEFHVVMTVTEPAADPQTGKFKEIFSKSFDVDLAAGKSETCETAFDLQPSSKGIASYRITDDKGTVVFYRTFEYTTSNPYRHYQPSNPKPLVVKARMAPSYGRILASADVIDYPGDKSKLQVEATVYRNNDPTPIGKGEIKEFAYDFGQSIIDVGKLTPGKYTVKFRSFDTGTNQPVGSEETVELTRKIYEWENNTIGYSDKVPDPWTPMKLIGDKATCWGREYTFTGLGLPSSIQTLQPEPTRGPKVRNILAAPVKLVAESDGRELKWNYGASSFTTVKETEIHTAGTAETENLKAEVDGMLDYDGLYKIHLKITPTKPVQLDSVRVEVPMPTDMALLFNHCAESMRSNKTFADFEGAKDGIIWNSKDAAHNTMMKGNFVPIIWMGDDDRGIGWMCDNDRTWVTTFDKACLDVVRKGKVTSFRMHLLNKPGLLTKPIEVTFSLQATPFRPRSDGGSWKQVPWYGWSEFDKPLIWDKCFDDYDQGKGYKWYVTDDAKKGDLWWRYFCFNSDRISEDDPTYGQMVKDFGAEWYVDAPLAFVQNDLHTDFILWAYKQWHDRAHLTGSYHDNTFPISWPDLINDRGWIDDDGNLRSGYWVFAYRDFAKRERTYWVSQGKAPVTISHITDAPVPGYLGFSDFWLDGENGGYPDPSVKDPDFVDRWYSKVGMANLRITMGRQWGVMPRYLYKWGFDPTQTILGQLDIDNCSSRVTDLPFTFGIDQPDCRFMPFWDVKKPAVVTAGGPDVLVGTWSRPKMARILVSNCSSEDRTVDVQLKTKLLGLPAGAVAYDDQTGDPVTYTDGKVTNIQVERHNYRAVVIAAPGLLKPIPASTDALYPGKRISGLCDDFTTTKAWKLMGPDIDGWNGQLRIQGQPFATARRPFGEDNCSVSIRVQNGNGPQWTNRYWTAYPSIMLYWKKGNYAGVNAGYGFPEPDHTNRSFASIDGKLAQGPLGPKAEAVNWLRITLKPETIEFYSSSDGKTWTELNTIPRKGLEGAPSYLYVGRGSVGEPDDLINGSDTGDGTAYFDDLVTWR